MAVKYALLLLAAACISISGSTLPDDTPFTPFVSGGTNTVVGQYPSIVAVGLPAPPNNAFCGGVIIHETHVLTAARCVLTPQNTLYFANQVTILSGALQLNFAAPRIAVTAIYVHPQFNPFNYANNIAVLRTASSFFPPMVAQPNIGFAAFNQEVNFDGQQCQAIGWNNATATPVQQFINAPVLNRDTCNGLAVHLGRIEESMMCAGSTAAGPGVCASNIGTGLFCEGVLSGILSTGLGCGQANNPGVYMQTRYYNQWIQEQLIRQDIPPGGMSPIPPL